MILRGCQARAQQSLMRFHECFIGPPPTGAVLLRLLEHIPGIAEVSKYFGSPRTWYAFAAELSAIAWL